VPNIDELRSRYFINSISNDTFRNCKVTPLIDGQSYFNELQRALNTVGNNEDPSENSQHFIYIAGWFLTWHRDLFLDGHGRTVNLMTLLKRKAQRGVDVRVLGWISYTVMSRTYLPLSAHILAYNTETLRTIEELRREPLLANKCCLNILAHPAGSVHPKMVIVCNNSSSTAFTGGIDLAHGRYSDSLHSESNPPFDRWHDVQAKIEGPAVQSAYDFYKMMWNEIPNRVSYICNELETDSFEFYLGPRRPIAVITPNTPRIQDRTLPIATGTNGFNHHIQSLVTFPAANYGRIPRLLMQATRLSFAPNGRFTIKEAWRKAILAADTYIYIEDPFFWSIEIMSWLREAIQNHGNLRVILLYSKLNDPGDPPLPNWVLDKALWEGLIQNLNQSQRDRIKLYGRQGMFIHAKTTLIDDNWAIIGSANVARRSLYTDIEHSIGILDQNNQLIKEYRVDLWASHFRLSPQEKDELRQLSISDALEVWWQIPGSGLPGSGITPPNYFELIYPPSNRPTRTENEQMYYDTYQDPDSRQQWRGY
jgi:phosphatidylserine/phosphatidylglycerophosphate/cardiolipin synthase-like enzyme